MQKLLLCFILYILNLSISSSQNRWTKTEDFIVADPPFKECHASTIVELPNRELMVAFFAGSRESNKDVSIWLTTRRNNKWEKPIIIADGIINDSVRFACWNPVLFRSQEGRLFLFYKVGPNPREWWGMVKTSVDNGKSWSKAERLPAGILGPIKNKPVQLHNGTLLSPSSVETESNWRVQIEKSSDGGNTWKTIPVDSNSAYNVIQPSILKYSHSRLQIVCRSNQNRLVSAWSYDNGNSWGKFTKLDLLNPNSGIDAVTLKNRVQLIVYNPTIRGKDWFNNREKLNVAISKDGITWKDIAILENGANGSNEEFSYPAVIETRDGKVHITYTYNRKTIKHVTLSYK